MMTQCWVKRAKDNSLGWLVFPLWVDQIRVSRPKSSWDGNRFIWDPTSLLDVDYLVGQELHWDP